MIFKYLNLIVIFLWSPFRLEKINVYGIYSYAKAKQDYFDRLKGRLLIENNNYDNSKEQNRVFTLSILIAPICLLAYGYAIAIFTLIIEVINNKYSQHQANVNQNCFFNLFNCKRDHLESKRDQYD